MVGIENHLCVTGGVEVVTQPSQLLTQLYIVVDRAVKDDCQLSRLIHHRLVAALREIKNREATMPQL